jgi:hypothetical protein
MSNTVDVTGGKPIAVLLQSISGVSAINPFVAFCAMEERERCYSFILSRTPHETVYLEMAFSQVAMAIGLPSVTDRLSGMQFFHNFRLAINKKENSIKHRGCPVASQFH